MRQTLLAKRGTRNAIAKKKHRGHRYVVVSKMLHDALMKLKEASGASLTYTAESALLRYEPLKKFLENGA